MAMSETAAVQKVLSRLRNQCSRREYCVSDVREKAMKALDGDENAAETVVESLKRDKYVDDSRYCAAYAREKASISGWGAVKIRYMLSHKGLSGEDIDAGIAEIDENGASARLEKLLAAKFRTLKDDPQRKLKLLRFALGRGYQYDEVSAVLSHIEKGAEYEEI